MLVGAFFLFYGTRVMQDAANTHTLRYMSAHVRLLPSLRSRASPANFDIHNTNLTTVQNFARGGDHGTIPWLPATQQHTGTTPTPTHTHIHGPSRTLVQRETLLCAGAQCPFPCFARVLLTGLASFGLCASATRCSSSPVQGGTAMVLSLWTSRTQSWRGRPTKHRNITGLPL